MKNKYLILFAVVLAALVVLYAVQQRSTRITVVETGIVQVLPDLNTAAVSEIDAYVTGEESKLILKRDGDSWTIPSDFNERADKGKIETLLSDLKDLKGEVRASKEALYDMFEVQEGKALVLDLLDKEGRRITTLFVGKRGPSGSGGFLRIKGRPEVYLADKNVAGTFGLLGEAKKAPEPKTWVDLRLLQSSKNQWARVEFNHPEFTAVFVKEKLEPENSDNAAAAETKETEPASIPWVQKKPEKPAVGDAVLQRALDALGKVRANQVLDPAKPDVYGLEKPGYRIRIASDGGGEVQLLANRPKKDGPVYVKMDNSNQVFEISEPALSAVFDPIKQSLTQEKVRKSK
ncbi:MAG: DUF4340 domain-containing protein [Deltaproteobacteria bacterium]|nr:DUF4340 domain-containing protein [Deltaproteobacteria bacterium]